MNRPLDQTTQVIGQSSRYWQVGAQGSPLVLIHGLTAKLAVLDNCGRAPMIEHAAQFTQLTLDFLAKP